MHIFQKYNLSIIHYFLFVRHPYFLHTATIEMHGHFIYGKGDTKHPNDGKYKFRQHKKKLYLPICKYCFRWIFDQEVLASKEYLKFIVTAVWIWPK